MNTFSLQPEKLLFGVFIIIVYGLKTIGLAPISLQTKKPTGSSRNASINVFLYSKIGLFYNLMFSILILTLGAFEMLNLVSDDYSNEFSIDKVLDMGHYIFVILTAWFQIVYWGLSQDKVAYIMNRLFKVHCLLSALKKQSSIKRTLIFLAMHTAFNVSGWISFIVFERIQFKSLFDTAAVSLPIFVNYWFLLEYSMVLGYMVGELESLNMSLLTVREFPGNSLHRFLINCDTAVSISSNHNQLADVKLLHSVRSMLYEVSQDVADFFSFPILPVILLFFYMIVYNIYYITILVISPADSSHSLSVIIRLSTAWLCISVYPIVLLSFYVTKTTKEAKLTAQVVHKLLASTRKQELVTEIFGATATYLIIIIQFVQSAKT